MNFNEALLFPLSDALQLPLYFVEGRFRAHKEQTLKAGPWVLKSEVMASTDELGVHRVSIVSRIRKSLWAYMICDQQGQRLRCVLFDGDRVNLRSKDLATFCTGDTVKTLDKIKGAIVGSVEFKDEKWSDFDVSGNLVQRLTS